MMSTNISNSPLVREAPKRSKPSKTTTDKQIPISQQRKNLANSAASEPALIRAAKNALNEEERQRAQFGEKFGGLRAECIDDDFLYRLCHVANDILESATILVRESGMTIQTTDPQSVAVIIVDMPAKMFSSYRCEGFVTAHINMETIVNMLKKTGSDHAKFKLLLEIHADDPETMYVKIFDSKKKTTTEHTVKLWEPKDIVIYFDQGQFPNYRVVSSRAWHEEINNLSHLIDSNKPIRIQAGNDLQLSIEDEYGESTTKFQQNKSPGYKVVQKYIDVCAKDEQGNYTFFNEIEGLVSNTDTASKKRKASALKQKAIKQEKKQKKKPTKRRRADDEAQDDEQKIKKEEKEEEDNDDDEEDEPEEESDEFLSVAQLTKFAQPVIEDDDEDAQLFEKPEKKIEDVKLTVSLLLLKMISKGLRLDPELYLLIKKNYPMMFVQRVKTHGRILIALSPKVLDDEEANTDSNEPNAMDSLMALESE